MKKRNLFISLMSLFIILPGITSCQFSDVADFMEKYTETAAIEAHEFSVETYVDELQNICISSEAAADVNLYMRNPKRFSLIPSFTLEQLESGIDSSSVSVTQTASDAMLLKLPQEFLIAADEGKNITTKISLYEPMSGRNFQAYTVNLSCNTIPPLLLNPTIINNNETTFVIAFDMPNAEEMAIRHKDVCAVEIDGVSYPVHVTATTDSDGNPKAVYSFDSPQFTRTPQSTFIFINQKTFTNTEDSVYFDTGIPFAAIDKEFTLVLKDAAGLKSTVKASTTITKLQKPVIYDQTGLQVSEGGIANIPFDEDTEKGKIKIVPPLSDHLGNSVSGAIVHYKVYEATGSGIIYTSGTTESEIEIELPQNTYRVEAYASLTNYENSATTTVKFRFVNNMLYVQRGFVNGDGSEIAPFGTIAEAIADIASRPEKANKFIICVDGDFSTSSEADLTLSGEYNTEELVIQKNPSGTNGATFHSITLDSTLDSSFKVTIGDVTVTNASGNGIVQDSTTVLTLKNTVVTGCSGAGVQVNLGTVHADGASVTYCSDGGINVGSNGALQISGSTVVNNNTRVNGLETEAANVILPAGKLIQITGAVSDSCRVGVTTATGNPSGTSKIQIATGGNNSMSFVNAFFSDHGYLVVPYTDGSGVPGLAFAIYSGGISYTAADYSFNLYIDGLQSYEIMGVYPGHTKTYSLNPKIAKRSGTTDLYCKPENYKLYEDAAYTTMDPLGETVSISAALYLDNIKVKDISVSGLTFTITADNLMVDGESYLLAVEINYMGVLYTQRFIVECARNDDYL